MQNRKNEIMENKKKEQEKKNQEKPFLATVTVRHLVDA